MTDTYYEMPREYWRAQTDSTCSVYSFYTNKRYIKNCGDKIASICKRVNDVDTIAYRYTFLPEEHMTHSKAVKKCESLNATLFNNTMTDQI